MPRKKRLFRQSSSTTSQLVREMRVSAGITQAELARKLQTKQAAIWRAESDSYAGHSLRTLREVAKACGFRLKLQAKKRGFKRAISLA